MTVVAVTDGENAYSDAPRLAKIREHEQTEAARHCLPIGVTSDVIVVSDSSTDKTAEVARRLLRKSGIVVCTDAGRVGAARCLAADVALQRYRGPREYCWLANTDADCEVPAN
jgi:glycosyltransferase involved in cell wall biosynthesis